VPGFKTKALLFRVHGYIRVALDATLSLSLCVWGGLLDVNHSGV